MTGINGLGKLQESFKDFEFKGKGKEKEDLGRILNKIEQWIHALHPKRPFDQCLERMEVLGMKKKSIKTQIKKIRMGLMPTVVDETPVEPMFEDEYEHLFPRVENETEETPWRRRTLSSSDEEPESPDIPTLEEQLGMEDDILASI